MSDATHGLGIAFGAFALGNSGGDIVGGSLAEHHRGVACLVSAALASAALLSLTVFGWKETAPLLEKGRRRRQRWWWPCFGCCCAEKKEEEERGRGGRGGARSSTNGEGARRRDAESGSDLTASGRDDRCWAEDDDGGEPGRGNTRNRGKTKLLNPLLVLKVFLESRYAHLMMLLLLSVVGEGICSRVSPLCLPLLPCLGVSLGFQLESGVIVTHRCVHGLRGAAENDIQSELAAHPLPVRFSAIHAGLRVWHAR